MVIGRNDSRRTTSFVAVAVLSILATGGLLSACSQSTATSTPSATSGPHVPATWARAQWTSADQGAYLSLKADVADVARDAAHATTANGRATVVNDCFVMGGDLERAYKIGVVRNPDVEGPWNSLLQDYWNATADCVNSYTLNVPGSTDIVTTDEQLIQLDTGRLISVLDGGAPAVQ